MPQEQFDDRFIRFDEVQHLVGVRSRSALKRWIDSQGFPRPIKFPGARTTAWSLNAIKAWMAEQLGSANER
jgi:predicted DNA-binding transcriptional regulator AlpA